MSHDSPPSDETSATLCTEVVHTVAEATGRDSTSLPSLYEAIDPDALNMLFKTTPRGCERAGQLSFPYAGCSVTVSVTGDERTISVEVAEPTAGAREFSTGSDSVAE